jgi:hypothetical protein
MKTVQVEIKNVYGSKVVYPVCQTAKLLSNLAGTKTFTPSAIVAIKDLGYQFEIVQPESLSI